MSGSDTYRTSRVIEALGMQGGNGEFYLDPLPDHDVLEAVVWIYATSIAEARTQALVSSSLELIGEDADALASAQAALAIPSPVNPADIDHNDLAARDAADAHPADAIEVTPAGDIAATDVQAAIEELDSEKEPRTLWNQYQPLAVTPWFFAAWTTSTAGLGSSVFTNRAQWLSQQRVPGVFYCTTLSTGTETTGTNEASACLTQRALYLYDNFRMFVRHDVSNFASFSQFRIGVWTNDPTPPVARSGRPTYGIWLEFDAATNGNSNWWLCAANGSTVSTADTGISATTSGQRAWILEYEGTASLKAWELNTSSVAAVATLTTNLPSGGGSDINRAGVAFFHGRSANSGTNGHILLFDLGLLRNAHPNWEVPA